jgi:hypothetical protein
MRCVVLATLASLFTACFSQTEEPVRTVDRGLVRYLVAADLADPKIVEFHAPNYVYLDTRAAAQGRLLVFLPGSNAGPERLQKLLVVAARIGMHAIGLQYNNSPSLKRLCPDGDPDCFERARLDIVYGFGDRVDRAHSVENRLISLLAWLHRGHPEEGWGQYLADGAPVWERIVFAGHSQGGSHVGLIARDHVVDRAILLGNSPSWIDDDHRTPIGSYYGFIHRGDHAADRLAAFSDFGFLAFGDPVNVDEHEPPYNGSHLLLTELPTEKPHSAIVADARVPDGPDGEAIYAPAWRYLLGGGD